MKNILVLISLLLLVSCNSISYSQIGEKINKKCPTSSCEIAMSDIVSGNWEYMYVFNTNVSLDQINKELGFDYPFFEDIANRVVFVKNNKIIYHEDEFPNPERIKEGELYFDNVNVNTMKISKKEASFIVTKQENYFMLTLKK